MAEINLNTKTKNFTITPQIQTLLDKRILPLNRFLAKESADVTCDIELSKTTEHHHAGKIFRAEINLAMGGYMLRAEAEEETMESAIDRAKNELKTELRKLTSRNESIFRRGARRAKDMFRFN